MQLITELDHWGKFEAEMLKAGEDVRRIRDEEQREELNEYMKDLNVTESTEQGTELFDLNDINSVNGDLDKFFSNSFKKSHKYVFTKL